MTDKRTRGTFGPLLRRHRVAAGLSHEELAERAGVSRRAISDLERGVHRAAYPATARRLAVALSLDTSTRAALLAAGRGTAAGDLSATTAAGRPLPVPLS